MRLRFTRRGWCLRTTPNGVLLVDACNAFNQLNRRVALYNVSLLCPPLAANLVNTYRANAMLFVDGATLFSCEGTTQGDPLALVFYALATLPLIEACKVTTMTGEVWFAMMLLGVGLSLPFGLGGII